MVLPYLYANYFLAEDASIVSSCAIIATAAAGALIDVKSLPRTCEPQLMCIKAMHRAPRERHLDRNGTRIIKFFLHLSKEEQRKGSSTASISRRRTGKSA